MTEVKSVPVKQININPLNPRKFVDDNALKELAESIRGVGLIQPIIIRPNGKENMFEIVCGERRFRAVQMLDLETIDAEVVELDDKQTLEYMITENMQRADILPMEEAEAFKALADLGYSLDDLVAKFGKNAKFIRLRLKLNDLIPDFRKLLTEDIIGVGHAQEICKLSTANQKEYFKSRFAERGKFWDCPSINDLKREIGRNFLMDLSKANFDPKDEKLVKKAGACTVCPKNTAADTILFHDMPITGVCLDRECFKKKVDTQFKNMLKEITENEPDTMLCKPRWVNSADQKIVEAFEKDGLKIETPDLEKMYDTLDTPEPPDPVDEEDYDDMGDLQQARDEYQGELQAFEKEVEEYQKKLTDPATIKCFMVIGDDRGTVFYLTKKKVTKQEAKKAGKDSPVTEAALEYKIKDIEDRAKRNKEIFVEKTYNDAQAPFDKLKYGEISEEFTELEMAIFYWLLSQFCGYNERISFDNAKKITAEGIYKLSRKFIRKNLLGRREGEKEHLNLFLNLFEERYPEEYAKVKKEHQETLTKRLDSAAKRVSDLKVLVKSMKKVEKEEKPKEPAKPAAKKSEPKKKAKKK